MQRLTLVDSHAHSFSSAYVARIKGNSKARHVVRVVLEGHSRLVDEVHDGPVAVRRANVLVQCFHEMPGAVL